MVSSEWTRHPGDTVPNTFIGSLAAMQPRDSIGLCTVYLEQLKEWLSNVEGPDLIEGMEAAKPDRLLGMAVSFDPVHYYPPTGVNAVVEMGLVFKPAYIPMVSFSSLLTTLMEWTVNLKERLSEACLTFLNVSPESEVYPLCRDYPVLVDLISKELVSSHFHSCRHEESGHKLPCFQAAATTAIELPNSTTSAMETSGDGEGPNSGAPPLHSVSTQRPLQGLMRDITFEAKDGDIIFPITPVGRPPPYDHELSANNCKIAEETMKKICSLHLQAIYNAGAVRQVDRILAALLMAQFTRVNQMMGMDLNTSLQELFTVVETSGDTLVEELKTALGPMVSNLVPYNLQQVVESHNSHLYMSLTKVLVFLDSARREGRDFLEDLVESLQTNEELKKLVTVLSMWISAFEDHIWELALSKELAKEEVALCVNLALTTTRSVIGNYFNGVLEGLMGSLGIKVHADKDPPHSTQEGLERCLAEELQ